MTPLLSCCLCPHHCRLAPGQKGRCHMRYNDNGTLRTLTYGQCSALALDPIEKKAAAAFSSR